MNIASTLSKKKVKQIGISKFIQKLNFPFIIFNSQSMYKFDTMKFIYGWSIGHKQLLRGISGKYTYSTFLSNHLLLVALPLGKDIMCPFLISKMEQLLM